MDALKRLQRARAGLVMTAPFYATLALGMELVEDETCETMATDGTHIFYAPAFVAECTDAQLRGLMVHEVQHVANGHHYRRGTRDPEEWNIACDFAINPAILTDGFELPPGGCIDPKYDGKSAEKIFAERAKDKQQGGNQGQQPGAGQQSQQPGQGKPKATPGGVRDAAAPHDKAGLQAAELETKARVMQAAAAAKAQGDMNATAQRLVAEIRQPVVDWRAVLRRYIDAAGRTDYAWHRPNRRFVAQGIYLPGQIPDGMGKIIMLWDVSGSTCDPKTLSAFMSELQAAFDEAGAEEIEIIQCDTQIRARDTFRRGDAIKVQPQGGGGTNMQPGLDACRDAAVVVCLTDLEFGSQTLAPPAAPVLWAQWGDGGRVPAFGEVIKID